jgi:O-glycosyl hydrolase
MFTITSIRHRHFSPSGRRSISRFYETLECRHFLSANVTLDPSVVHQTIRGLGGDAARVVWAKPGDEAATDPHGQFALDHLQDTVVRVGIPWKQWEPANDNTDPNSINPAGFKDDARVHSAFQFLQQLKSRGSTIIATAWEAPDWLWTAATNPLGGPSHTIPDSMYAEAAESLTAYLIRARDVYGVTIPYLSFNESNFGIQIFMAADRMARFIEFTGKQFAAAGLPTKWLVGDTFSTESLPEYAKPILDYAPARPYLGPISYHSWWAEGKPDSFYTRIADLAKQYGKEVWSPEVGYDALVGKNQPPFATWDNAIRLAKVYNRVIKLSQANVAMYWEYGMVGGGDVNDFPLTDTNLKPYPAYYVLKQLNDNLVPGSKILSISSDDPAVMTLASRDPAKNNTFVQLINTSGAASTVTVKGLPLANYAVRRDSASENDKQVATFQSAGGTYTITLPASSVTVLTTLGQPPINAQSPFSGTPIALPGTIQAESYDKGGEGVAYHDTTAANDGKAYRNDGGDVEAISGGYALDFTKAGEWTEYTVNVPQAGDFDLAVRYASLRGGGRFHVEVDGKSVTPSLTASSTGAWGTYKSLSAGPITLAAGQHVIRLAMDANDSIGFVANFDSLTLTKRAASGPTPFRGTPFKVGDTIQAEDFDNGGEGVAFHDTTGANEGTAYRSTGVDVQPTTDSGGGFNVGFTHAGEWLDYTITVATTGTYKLDTRVAALATGGNFHVEFNGANKTGSIAIPATGGWQSWRTIGSSSFSLGAGTYVMRVVFDRNQGNGYAGNVNSMKIRF